MISFEQNQSIKSNQSLISIQKTIDQFKKINPTNENKELVRKKSQQQLFNEHIKVIIIIGSISVGIMIIIVSTYITIQYFANKRRFSLESSEQTVPLNTSKRKAK